MNYADQESRRVNRWNHRWRARKVVPDIGKHIKAIRKVLDDIEKELPKHIAELDDSDTHDYNGRNPDTHHDSTACWIDETAENLGDAAAHLTDTPCRDGVRLEKHRETLRNFADLLGGA